MDYYKRKKKNEAIEERQAKLDHDIKMHGLEKLQSKIEIDGKLNEIQSKLSELVSQKQQIREYIETKVREFNYMVQEYRIERGEGDLKYKQQKFDLEKKEWDILFVERDLEMREFASKLETEYRSFLAEKESFMIDKSKFALEDTRQKLLMSYYDDIYNASNKLNKIKSATLYWEQEYNDIKRMA